MIRTAALLVLFAAAGVRADVAVPPPPGKKFVPVEHTIRTDQAYPGYDFYVLTGYAAKKVEFGPDTPAVFTAVRAGGPPVNRMMFVAVPKGAAEKAGGDAAFAKAVRANAVPGQAVTPGAFEYSATIDAKDDRKVVKRSHAVERIDPKEGIVLKAAKGPAAGDKNVAEDETQELPTADPAPRGGPVVAGMAVALALTFTGLWLARRVRG